jgi:GTP-binding protein Era
MTQPPDDDRQLPSVAPSAATLQNEVAQRWELARDHIHKALEERLVVAFLGSASAGKDSAVRAIFGLDFGQVDPIPGSTDRVRVAAVDRDGRVLVVNAPGFGDIRADVDRQAREILDQVDLAVYVLNADGGATIDERRDLDAIRDRGRPVLVCINKIDLIRPHERERFVEATLKQLGVDAKEAVVTAFDPLPALSETPIGVDEVVGWIHKHVVESGKDLVFAKSLRNKAVACKVIIQAAARRAAIAGAIPMVGVDATAVTAVQVKLIADIAAVYGRRMDHDLAIFILGEILAGGSKGFIRWSVTALKGAGWIPGGQIAHLATSALGATIAGATTYGVGRAAIAYMERGAELTSDELRSVFDEAAFAWRGQPS